MRTSMGPALKTHLLVNNKTHLLVLLLEDTDASQLRGKQAPHGPVVPGPQLAWEAATHLQRGVCCPR